MNKTHVLVGVMVSLLLHLLLAMWTWQHRIGDAHFAEKTTIAVHLLPLEKPAEALPPPPPPQIVKPQTVPRSMQKPPVIAATPTRVNKEQAQAPLPVQAPAPVQAPQQEKHLDMNAIYGSVKSTMKEIDRENADTPVGQLAAKPLYPPEDGNKMGKMINGTTRADCKDQVEGAGLFTPLLALATLLDKKDNGCKWR